MVIDNGVIQFLVGNVHRVISKKYDGWIGVDGPVGPSFTTTLQLVDAYSTSVYDSGKCVLKQFMTDHGILTLYF